MNVDGWVETFQSELMNQNRLFVHSLVGFIEKMHALS